MKSIVFSVLMFSMTLLFVSCENESQPTQNTSDMEKQLLSKKTKTDKKPHDGDLITFTGDLVGSATVMGCCPNAGPFPEYRMTLSTTFPGLSGTYDGQIFMNSTGRQSPGDYIVQFWWGEAPNDYFLEIRGGKAHNDKRNKILTVIFEDAQCEIWINGSPTETVPVNFILTRGPQ